MLAELPSISTALRLLGVGATRSFHNAVAATHHIVGSSGILMAILFVLAGEAGMPSVLSKAMGVTVIHCHSVVGFDRSVGFGSGRGVSQSGE